MMRVTNVSSRCVAICILLSLVVVLVTANEGRCQGHGASSFACPVCDGNQTVPVSDCLSCDGYLQTDMKHHQCIDRRLFNIGGDEDSHYHFLWNDIIGAVVWFITAGVAMACGIGGGGIFVPLGILLFQFAPKPASGLSQASIFGSSLGGLILNTASQHPNHNIRHDAGIPRNSSSSSSGTSSKDTRVFQKDLSSAEQQEYIAAGGKFYTRPLINFDMSLFMSPMITAGAVLGVLIQAILPNWMYLLSASVFLGWTAEKTYKKYFDSAKKEQQQAQKAKQAAAKYEVEVAATKTGETQSLLSGKDTENRYVEDSFNKYQSDVYLVQRKEFLERDMRQYPAEKITVFLVLWFGLFIITILKGGKGVPSLVGVECGTAPYSLLIVCELVWLLGFAAFFGYKLVHDQAARVAVQYPFLPDDPLWDYDSLRWYSVVIFVSGLVAGLVGIGGGMILGPLMILMGIHPQVSSATSATMIIMTSSSVAVMFVTSGMTPLSYAIFYFWVCLAGALIGKSYIDAYIKRTGKASILVLIMATIIALATVGCFVIMLMRLAEQDWCLDGFNQFCGEASVVVEAATCTAAD